MNNLHRRQFIICKNSVEKENFHSQRIQGNYFISYHRDLRLKIINQNGKVGIIIGNAFQIDINKTDITPNVSSYENLEKSLLTWAGRWIFIYDFKLYLDACGTLGCYYYQKDDDVYISSSTRLIFEETQDDTTSFIPIKHENGMDWYPGPLTTYKNIKKLLPSQLLNFQNNKVIPEIRNKVTINKSQSTTDEIIEDFQNYCLTYLDRLKSEYNQKILLPLTAGFDSRINLALCLKAGINVSTFTQEYDNISNADKLIPKKIASKLRIPHTFIKRTNKLDKSRLEEFDIHTDNYCVDEDRLFYAFDQFPSESSKTLLLRSSIWDGFRSSLLNSKKIESGDQTEKLNSLIENYPNVGLSEFHKKSITEWLSHDNKCKYNYDWRIRFYLEQRIGGWLSSIEQALDLTDLDSIHFLNSELFLQLLLKIPIELRSKSYHHIKIIGNCEPRLLKFPFNPPTKKNNFYSISKKIVKRIVNMTNSTH